MCGCGNVLQQVGGPPVGAVIPTEDLSVGRDDCGAERMRDQTAFFLVGQRKIIDVPRASKKQSPPVRGIGSGIPSTLSQQLPRESMAKCAKSVGEFFLPEGVTFSSVCFSCIKPHGAVASSLC